MLESARELLKGWFGGQDERKREHGSLDKWRRRHYAEDRRSNVAQRLRKRNPKSYRRTDQNAMRRGSTGLWTTVKSVFSPKDQELQQMRSAYADYKVPSYSDTARTSAQVQRRIATSAALKRKFLEKQYDDKLLDQLRRGRSLEPKPVSRFSRPLPHYETDHLVILQHKVEALTAKVGSLERDLQLTHKKLMFAREKNALLESLVNDANVDDEYVKSRRRITNFQKNDLKPEFGALPPSPRRAVSPLVTSSPIRLPYLDENDDEDDDDINDIDNHLKPRSCFYEKYPRIPTTEPMQKDPESSLSPIRVDLAKYSTSRDRFGD
ncbi:LAME_0F19790g1_1 [Lachancea meyersii CBS 8951]|uniref:LAME_0F19790g1_1 n=1 Tax=Lachancea meyersii CBS 8951 TaxID=1266667 RepID=A0A1G4K1M5_9SACH|nr:LAME_0F19790g1_1 [Lachancea meyersii CBS 8951]